MILSELISVLTEGVASGHFTGEEIVYIYDQNDPQADLIELSEIDIMKDDEDNSISFIVNNDPIEEEDDESYD